MIERESTGYEIIDRFGRTQYYEHIANHLINKQDQTVSGLVIGLTGPWGTGKSQALFSIENILNEKIDSLRNEHGNQAKPILVVKFNPWVHSGRDELLNALFENIYASVKDKKKVYGCLDKINTKHNLKASLKKAASYLDMFQDGMGKIAKEFADEPLEKVKAEILKNFKDAEVSVIVLVDEIDRLSDDEIRVMAQVIKSVADFPMFSYLLAYDPERVARALGGNDEKLGHYYLEKIVQVQCRLPRIDPMILIDFAKEKILPIVRKTSHERGDSEKKVQELENRFNEIFKFLIPEILSTPRDIYRLASSYAIRLPMAYSEVEELDLLRYCALETQVPLLSERLQLIATRLSVDGVRELRRRFDPLLDANTCIDTVLSPFEKNAPFRDLLVQLFPALIEGGQDFITRDDRRLCYETPLLYLLNFGNLPGTISPEKAIKALNSPDDSLRQIFEDAVSKDRLRHVILRLRTTACNMELSDDQISSVWRAFAKFFDRPFGEDDLNHWSSWQELTHVFVRGAMKRYLPQPWMKPRLIHELLDEGYIHLPATFLAFHIQAHHAFRQKYDPTLTTMLDRKETEDLVRIAADKFLISIQNSDKWFLRSINPLKVIFLGSFNSSNTLNFLKSQSCATKISLMH